MTRFPITMINSPANKGAEASSIELATHDPMSHMNMYFGGDTHNASGGGSVQFTPEAAIELRDALIKAYPLTANEMPLYTTEYIVIDPYSDKATAVRYRREDAEDAAIELAKKTKRSVGVWQQIANAVPETKVEVTILRAT